MLLRLTTYLRRGLLYGSVWLSLWVILRWTVEQAQVLLLSIVL
jgi:hypothetical protein